MGKTLQHHWHLSESLSVSHSLDRSMAMVLLVGLVLAVSGGQACFGVTLSEL